MTLNKEEANVVTDEKYVESIVVYPVQFGKSFGKRKIFCNTAKCVLKKYL